MPTACAWSAPARCASTRNRQPFLDKAREALGHPHRNHLRARRSAPDLFRRRADAARQPGQSPGGGHRRRQHRDDHRRGVEPLELESLKLGCVLHERALFRRRQAVRQALCARAPGRAAGTGAGAGGLPEARLEAGRRQFRHRALDLRCAEGAGSQGHRDHRRRHRGDHRCADLRGQRLRRSRWKASPRTGARCLPAAWPSSRRSSRSWASSRCAGPRARCARDCSTTWSAATRTRMRASAPCAPCSSATTWISTQAARVEADGAACCWRRCRKAGSCSDPLAELALTWACRLHEIGLDVAHSGYHRHGAYLLENADMPGFAREEQLLLARLVGAHRRKLVLEAMADLIPPWDARALYLHLILRLAVLLHRNRSAEPLPAGDPDWPAQDAGAAIPGALVPRSSADGGGPATARSSYLREARTAPARVHLVARRELLEQLQLGRRAAGMAVAQARCSCRRPRSSQASAVSSR